MSTLAFEPSSNLTFDTVESDLARLLKYVQAPESDRVQLNLNQVKQCNSAGLALLIEAKRLCKRYNKPFEIVAMPILIHELAEFCGVEAIL